jgi:hypothetical protein
MAKRIKIRKDSHVLLPRSVARLFPKVTVAVDADQSVDIKVSKKDCTEAKQMDPSECALARAVRRDMEADGAIIGLSSSYIIRGNKAIRFSTPERVQREIVSFDRNHDFAPGDYFLTPKSPSSRMGAPQYKKKAAPTSGAKVAKRKVHHPDRVRILMRGVE